ncbi:MAG: molybdenum cofactor biosynthesis protein MoaE [Myxococcales bacterium]|nr:molybdenum cofactor biosynthesis protein MoaE [Myxococcales bacterium]
MRVVVKLFGAVREAAGAKELSLDLPEGASVAELRDRLSRDLPVLDAFGERLAVSVNLDLVRFDTPLHEGDEVAFLPPVAGGGGACSISERPLDVSSVVARVSGAGIGGIVSFVGTVRDRARGRSIRHLEYEAYPEMAEREMQKIVDEAGRRWPGSRVAIAHRAGHLEVGEIAVVVVAAAPHRAEAFAACRFAIDTLKQTVPIWKKEIATDGEFWVDDRP